MRGWSNGERDHRRSAIAAAPEFNHEPSDGLGHGRPVVGFFDVIGVAIVQGDAGHEGSGGRQTMPGKTSKLLSTTLSVEYGNEVLHASPAV